MVAWQRPVSKLVVGHLPLNKVTSPNRAFWIGSAEQDDPEVTECNSSRKSNFVNSIYLFGARIYVELLIRRWLILIELLFLPKKKISNTMLWPMLQLIVVDIS